MAEKQKMAYYKCFLIKKWFFFFADSQDKIIDNHNKDVYETKCKEPESYLSLTINLLSSFPNQNRDQ